MYFEIELSVQTQMKYYYTEYWISKLLVTSIFTVFVVIFYTIWTIKVIQHLILSKSLHRVYKKKDFRDTREQDRILYNYETHIVKDVILIILSCAEIAEILIAFMSSIVTTFQLQGLPNMTQYEQEIIPNKCDLQNILLIGSGVNLVWVRFQTFIVTNCSIGFILLLSFLTSYLSKRYYQQSHYRSGFKYFIAFLSQLVLISILSNKEITLLQLLIGPVVLMIDWYVLVINSRKLRRVLMSNARNLDLNFNHRYLYIQQLKLLKTYNTFMPILLVAVFFGIFSLLFYYYIFLIGVIVRLPCVSDEAFRESIPTQALFYNLQEFGFLFLVFVHFLLLGSPLYLVTMHMFFSRCMKRFCTKESNLRFNYTNFSGLERYNLRSPY